MDKSFLYFVIFPNYNYLKIGKANNIDIRMQGLRHLWGDIDYENSYCLELPLNKVFKIEKALHNLLDDFKIKELSGDGSTEIFSLTVLDAALAFIDLYIKQQGDLKLVKGISKNSFSVGGVKKIKLEKHTGKRKLHRLLTSVKKNVNLYNQNINNLDRALQFLFDHYDCIEYQYVENNKCIDFYMKINVITYRDKNSLNMMETRTIKANNHVVNIDIYNLSTLFSSGWQCSNSLEIFDIFWHGGIFQFKSDIRKENEGDVDAIFKFSYSFSKTEEKTLYVGSNPQITAVSMFYENIIKMPKKSPCLGNQDLITKYNEYTHRF